MKDDAEKHAEEDLARKDVVEARNKADNMAYTAEKALTDLGEKVPEDVKTKVNDKVAEVRKVLEDENADAETLTRVADELGQVIQEIGAAAYQQPDAGPMPGAEGAGPEGAPPPPDGQAGPDDEDIVDGEFRNA